MSDGNASDVSTSCTSFLELNEGHLRKNETEEGDLGEIVGVDCLGYSQLTHTSPYSLLKISPTQFHTLLPWSSGYACGNKTKEASF
ncbi:hypothetical protein NPIL_40231 [Nephila pilipes]|uniref:Uncharacterized protein n=1 Tax=Nephila pilipes TaxID=299642 RepID=A0A8X6PYN1_NEPPI|nr:hypothetical protein NPIL_40231 [Nephila pilipes]